MPKTTSTKQSGRPERSKTSLFAEIQKHKRHIKVLEEEKEDLLALLEATDHAYRMYRNANIIKRIKYTITGDV